MSAAEPASAPDAGRTSPAHGTTPADTGDDAARQEQQGPNRPAAAEPDSRTEEIITSAAQTFAEYGYHGASLRTISGRAGISHPGMLHHFGSKEALLSAVIDQLEAYAQGALDRLEEFTADPDALEQALAEVWDPKNRAIQLLAMLDTDTVSDDHPGRPRMARLHRVHEHVLEQCFTAFEQRDQLREGIDPAFASRAVFALVLSHAVREQTVRTMQSDPHDDSPVKDLVRLTRAFLAPAADDR